MHKILAALTIIASALLLALVIGGNAYGFQQQSCGSEECLDCHVLTKEEAKELLGKSVDAVIEVNPCEVKGLWEVDVIRSQRKIPFYIDFSKNFLIIGDLFRIETRENLTNTRFLRLNTVDPSQIPTNDAVLLGKPSATQRIIVFDDPECPYCQKLLPEMKEVVARNEDVAFYIKMLPLKIHPNAAEKARAIICAKSFQMLEDSLNGKPVPPPACQTDQVEKNAELAQQLGITSVPTIVYPDGLVLPGFTKADSILQMLEQIKREAKEKGKE